MRAMILAAGLGKRLQPLSLQTPKVLIPILGQPLIVHVIQSLKRSGIQELVINVHHLRDQILSYLGDGSEWGVHIQYSIEDTLLETGGGVRRALPLLGPDPFVVVSGDLFSDYPFEQLQLPADSLAHLVFVDRPDQYPHGDFVLKKSRVALEGGSRVTYANIAIFHPDLFQGDLPAIFPLRRVFEPAILANQVTGELYSGKWFNVGTLSELRACESAAL